MKAHIGVDADSGLVHTVVATPANVHDLAVAGSLLHGDEAVVHADSGIPVSRDTGIPGHRPMVRYTRGRLRRWPCHRGPAKHGPHLERLFAP